MSVQTNPLANGNRLKATSTENQDKDATKRLNLRRVIEDLKNSGVQFFVNTLTEPVVFLPDSPFQQYWKADDDRVRSHLSAAYHDLSKGDYLKHGERDMVLDLLKAECYKGGRRLTEIEGPQTENDPIVQALIVFASETESFDGMTSLLLDKLREHSVQNRIQSDQDFPILTNIFSRRLNRLVPALRGLGIEVTIWHEEDGSHTKLQRLPNFRREPDASTRQSSVEPSVAKVAGKKSLDKPDDPVIVEQKKTKAD